MVYIISLIERNLKRRMYNLKRIQIKAPNLLTIKCVN